MPICIECRYPVPQLYHVLQGPPTKAPSASNVPIQPGGSGTGHDPPNPEPQSWTLASINSGSRAGGEAAKQKRVAGTDVRLTQCPRCKKFADKYIEHDFVVLFIDLVLVKPQVYRHVLINRLGLSLNKVRAHFDPTILRLALLLTLFDVYLTWSRTESLPAHKTAASPVPSWPIPAQYMYFMILSAGGTLAQHLAIRIFSRLMPSKGHEPVGVPAEQSPQHSVPSRTRDIAISTALIVSSCMKLFPLLMVVWKYDDAGGQVARGVKVAVSVQNLEALRAVLGCAYWQAALLVLVGRIAEDGIAEFVLRMGGLEETSVGWGPKAWLI